MKKHNFLNILFVATALIFTACSSEESLEPNDGLNETIKVDPSIDQISRIITDEQGVQRFSENDKFQLYVWSGSKEISQKNANNSIQTYTNGSWISNPPLKWNGYIPHYFLGIYPEHNPIDINLGALSFNHVLGKNEQENDLLIALNLDETNKPGIATAVPLKFKHIMAKLVVKLKININASNSDKIIYLNAKNAATISCNTAENTIDITPTGGQQKIQFEKTTLTNSPFNIMGTSVMIPQSGLRQIKIAIDNRSFTYTHTEDIPLESGKLTVVNLEVGEVNVELDPEGITCSAWDTTPEETNYETQGNFEPIVNKNIHSVTLLEEGYLTVDYLKKAYGEGTNAIEIKGPANSTDLLKIKEFLMLPELKNKQLKLELKDLALNTSILDNSLEGCTSLSDIILPSCINTIGNNAFSNTGLIKFEIPKSIKKLGSNILSDCKSLKSITLTHLPSELECSETAFTGIPANQVSLYTKKDWNPTTTFKGGNFKEVITSIKVTNFINKFITVNLAPWKPQNITVEALVKFNENDLNNRIYVLGNVKEFSLSYDRFNVIAELFNSTIQERNPFNSNQWYHVAYVFTKSDHFLYINGKEIGSRWVGSKEPSPFTEFLIGSNNFKGILKEVRIWDVARSQSDIIENMMSIDPKTAGLKVYYKLDGTDINGTEVKNASADNYHGIINAGDLTVTDSDFIEF